MHATLELHLRQAIPSADDFKAINSRDARVLDIGAKVAQALYERKQSGAYADHPSPVSVLAPKDDLVLEALKDLGYTVKSDIDRDGHWYSITRP